MLLTLGKYIFPFIYFKQATSPPFTPIQEYIKVFFASFFPFQLSKAPFRTQVRSFELNQVKKQKNKHLMSCSFHNLERFHCNECSKFLYKSCRETQYSWLLTFTLSVCAYEFFFDESLNDFF